MIDSRDFLDAVAGYANSKTSGPQSSANRPVRLGTIDQYYTSGPARVLFDGETVISERAYSWTGSYSPIAGERVYLVPVGQTYLIGGKLASSIPYSRYHNIELNTTGGWEPYAPATFHTPSFTKTESGLVKLTGMGCHTSITGPVTNMSILGYLPEGFRPPIDMMFPAQTGSTNASGTILVMTDGKIVTRNAIHGAWWSLGNIVYQTADVDWQTPDLLNGWELGSYSQWARPVQYGKDALGRVLLRGAFGESGTSKTSDSTVFNLPVGYRPGPQGVYASAASTLGAAGGFAHTFTDTNTGDFKWRTGSANDDEVSIDGTIIPPTDANWITPPMMNAWVSYGAANTPGYFKDADGLVHLRGLVKTGTITSAIFNLPAGYRPSKNIIRNTVSNAANSRFDILSNGNIQAQTGSNVWVSLDNMVFTAEA